jgi:hypothetical protein
MNSVVVSQMHALGGDGIEISSDMIACSNSDLLLIGSTASDADNASNAYLVRLDTNLVCIWSKSLGGVGIETGISAAENTDGQILAIAQTSATGDNGYGIAAYMLNANGDLQWEQILGGNDWDFPKRVVHDGNNGFWIVGSTYSFGNGGTDALIIHINSEGVILNQWTYGTTVNDEFIDIDQLNDGSWLLTGNQMADDTTSIGWMATIAENGLLTNFDAFGGDSLSARNNQTIVHDDFIVHVGHVFTNGITNGFLRRLHQDGTLSWEHIEPQVQSNSNLKITYYNENYYLAAKSKAVGPGQYSALLMRCSWGGWYTDGLIYGSPWEDQFVSTLWNTNLNLYALGDYSYSNGSSNFIIHKQSAEFLTSDGIGNQIELDCFTVDVTDISNPIAIVERFYYNWLGQSIDPSNLPLTYIRRDIYSNGAQKLSKFVRE